MRWTSDKPTREGWYWWKAGAHVRNPECMYIEQLRIFRGKLVSAYMMEPPQAGQWAGPIEPPEEEP